MSPARWVGMAAVLLLAACSSDTSEGGGSADTTGAPAAEAVTIVTDIDFSAQPFGGTFAVERGAQALGCSSGSFVDALNDFGGIDKVFTCEDGAEGTFTVKAHTMTLGCDPGPPEVCNGSWAVDGLRSTGDFAGLFGFGEFEVLFDEPSSGVETLRGEIHYEEP